jgi:hypothetical protein
MDSVRFDIALRQHPELFRDRHKTRTLGSPIVGKEHQEIVDDNFNSAKHRLDAICCSELESFYDQVFFFAE